MTKHFQSLQGDHGSIAKKLNELSFCKKIKVINATPAMFTSTLGQQTPGLICLIEFHYEEPYKKKFDQVLNPGKLEVAK